MSLGKNVRVPTVRIRIHLAFVQIEDKDNIRRLCAFINVFVVVFASVCVCLFIFKIYFYATFRKFTTLLFRLYRTARADYPAAKQKLT